MYKTILILIVLTLSLSSCYTQFSTGASSSPYLPAGGYNYDNNADNESTDYYEGQYEPTNETEINYYYYGNPWYSDYYFYPRWGYYTGWYSPFYTPGFICYPAYTDYYYDGGYFTPIERTPRPFDKGRENRNIPKKKRTHRPSRNTGINNNNLVFTDLSSGSVIAVKSGRSGKKQNISSTRNPGNGGHVIAVLPTSRHQNQPGSKRPPKTTRRHKKRIYYTPGRSASKSTAKRGVGGSTKGSRTANSSSRKYYSSPVRGGNSSAFIGSHLSSSSSSRRSSSSSVSHSSLSSGSRNSSIKVVSRSRRRR